MGRRPRQAIPLQPHGEIDVVGQAKGGHDDAQVCGPPG